MDEVHVTLDLEGRVLAKAFDALLGRLSDLSPVTQEAGAALAGSVRENFLAQGRPRRWEPLAPATVRRKGHATGLFETGRLAGSVGFAAGADFVSVTVGAPYAGVHDSGGGSVIARPFLVLQDADVAALKERIAGYLASGS